MSGLRDAEKYLGKVVESVWLSPHNEMFGIVFDDGSQAVWQAEGDCCAHAWIEHIELLDFKGRLAAVLDEEPELTAAQQTAKAEDTEDSVLDICFYDVRTERGRMLIELRVSHNGYYGGWLEPCESAEVSKDWREIT